KADAMQPAGGRVNLAAELASGMERSENHLERGFVAELGVRIDRNAASVVANGHDVVSGEFQLDSRGVPGDRLVHRIVEDLGDEVVEGALIGPTDIHARTPAYRLEPFQDLDILRRIGVLSAS